MRPSIVAALAALTLVAGCSGIPASSHPQIVASIGGAGASVPPVGPPRDADARTIVEGFLSANATDPVRHASAREFLTAAARTQWSDATATVISDESIGSYDERHHTVSVSGRVLGTLNAAGIYTAQLNATSGAGQPATFRFLLDRVGGQYRIASLNKGLVLTADQFSGYSRRTVYFYDKANRYLVPDLRYCALQKPALVADWLLAQLVAGPRPELQSAVNLDTLPAQARQVVATIGSVTRIAVPGSSQLSGILRDRLAAQLSQTLDANQLGAPTTIVDANSPVQVPAAHGTVFSASNFAGALGPAPPAPNVYYLRGGRVHDQDGAPVAGPLGNGSYYLDSVALARPSGLGLAVAGVQRVAGRQRLAVGTVSGGLHATSLIGQLSRPAWAPGLAEVWIGSGSRLYRVTTNGRTSAVSQVPLPSLAGGARIVALRFSPDGSRLALILGANGLAQLYEATVVRAGGRPLVLTPQAISPGGVVLSDVAWVDSEHLFATGYLTPSKDARIFDLNVDGSRWNARGISNLPAPPTTLTATTNALVWVSSQDGYVWVQSGSTWVSPIGSGQTAGTDPVYLG